MSTQPKPNMPSFAVLNQSCNVKLPYGYNTFSKLKVFKLID